MSRHHLAHPLILCSDRHRPAFELAVGLMHMREGTPARQRTDALETACGLLAAKLGMNHTLDELYDLCEIFHILINNAGLPGYPCTRAVLFYGRQPGIAVYELELPSTRRADSGTLGQRLARMIAALISQEEYTYTSEEHDDYGAYITFHR